MKNLSRVATIVAALSIGIVTSVSAHHSAAGIDRNKSVTVEGTVKEFHWGNPHSWIELEVANPKGGAAVSWNFEMTSPAVLVRAGWKSTIVKAGDKVKVSGRPFSNGDPGGLFTSLTLPDGKVMTEQGAPAAPAAPGGRGAPGAPAAPAAGPGRG